MLTSKHSHVVMASTRQPFASFMWPRHTATLPTGSLTSRLAERKAAVTSKYYAELCEITREHSGLGFYLDDAGQPFTRWEWADEIPYSPIEHTGWFADDDQSTKIRALVAVLPHGRFLAGWAMTDQHTREGGGIASVSREVFDCINAAARWADQLAEGVAEDWRELCQGGDDAGDDE